MFDTDDRTIPPTVYPAPFFRFWIIRSESTVALIEVDRHFVGTVRKAELAVQLAWRVHLGFNTQSLGCNATSYISQWLPVSGTSNRNVVV